MDKKYKKEKRRDHDFRDPSSHRSNSSNQGKERPREKDKKRAPEEKPLSPMEEFDSLISKKLSPCIQRGDHCNEMESLCAYLRSDTKALRGQIMGHQLDLSHQMQQVTKLCHEVVDIAKFEQEKFEAHKIEMEQESSKFTDLF